MRKRFGTMSALLLVFAWVIAASSACGGEGLEGTQSGQIAANPSQVAFSLVEIGSSGERFLSILNTADDEDLQVFGIELQPRSEGRIDELSLVDLPDFPARIEAGNQIDIRVRYTPSETGGANRGQIRIPSSDPRYTRDEPLTVNVDTLTNSAELFVDPPMVRFQRMQPGQSTAQTLRLTNVGSAPLILEEEPSYSGGADFRISASSLSYPATLLPYSVDGAEQSPDDYVLEVEVTYRPLGAGADTGQIQVMSNDPSGTREIPVLADADAPCIEVDSRIRNFGQVPIGNTSVDRVEVRNCGSQTLIINDVFFEESQDPFRLDLGTWDQSGNGSIDSPITLAPGASDAFNIRFIPIEERTERATVIVGSNDPVQPALKLDLVGRGAVGTCPTAVALASVRGGGSQPRASITAVPLQYVILDGSQSTDEEGNVVEWEWEVLERPPGTNVTLGPTQQDTQDQDQSRREFRPLTAGTYRIGLTVVDDSGFQSCNQAEATITAIPDQNIHIELTWTNPEDPDETNDFGSDLDLHLTKMGPGNWFETPYSVFYLNPNITENPIWNPEDPSLDIDVRDGMGPENITMRNPDNCQWYAVGVHYYQRRFGTAYATVRIYINTNLVYERPFFPLENTRNFWDVARIHWDSTTSNATVVEVDSFYPVEPAGSPPVVTNDMSSLGLCTAEGLY